MTNQRLLIACSGAAWQHTATLGLHLSNRHSAVNHCHTRRHMTDHPHTSWSQTTHSVQCYHPQTAALTQPSLVLTHFETDAIFRKKHLVWQSLDFLNDWLNGSTAFTSTSERHHAVGTHVITATHYRPVTHTVGTHVITATHYRPVTHTCYHSHAL